MIFVALAALAIGQRAAEDASRYEYCCTDAVLRTALNIEAGPQSFGPSQRLGCSSLLSDAFTETAYNSFLDMEKLGQPLLNAAQNACLWEIDLMPPGSSFGEKANDEDGSGCGYWGCDGYDLQNDVYTVLSFKFVF